MIIIPPPRLSYLSGDLVSGRYSWLVVGKIPEVYRWLPLGDADPDARKVIVVSAEEWV